MRSTKKGEQLQKTRPTEPSDPVLAMLGVGRELWEQEPGDRFVERLRSEDAPAPPPLKQPAGSAEDLPERVWRRVQQRQGEEFRTATRLPLTFQVEGNGIWFYRGGKRINRKLSRSQFAEAVRRCPLKSTTEIKDLIDYPYLFAILMDQRIRDREW